MDLFSRQIVGWKIEDYMQENLVREPLEKALLRRGVKPGLIVHRSGEPVRSWRSISVTQNEVARENFQAETKHVPR